MAGYLANYGAGEEQREKRTRRLVIAAAILLALVGLYWLTFDTPILEKYIRVVQELKNRREEKQSQAFLELLRKGDYKAAYALWGCTDARPCRDYPLQSFLADWGPGSSRIDTSSLHITRSRSCGSGVILTIDSAKNQEDKLWVERSDLTLGFSPWPGCPPGR